MEAIVALAKKDLRLLFRDRTGLLFTFGVPILFATFFGAIFGGDGDNSPISLALVDEDQSERSEAFAVTLEEAEELEVTRTTRVEATDQVRRGEVVAFIVLTDGFGASRERLFFGEPPRIELGVDPARQAEASMLEGILTRYGFEAMADVLRQPEGLRPFVEEARVELQGDEEIDAQSRLVLETFLNQLDGLLELAAADEISGGWDESEDSDEDEFSFTPVQIDAISITPDRTTPRGPYDITFPQGMVWGLIACIAAFATSLVNERSQGTLVKLRMAPIANAHILGGKALACFLTSVAVIATLFGLGTIVFGIQPDSWFFLVLSTLVVSLSFVGIMLFLSTIGKTERTVGNVSWVIMMVLAMLGGGMIPLAFMPDWMGVVSHISPVKWAVLAIEGAVWRDFSFADMLLPYGVLLGVGVGCFAVGLRSFRIQQ